MTVYSRGDIILVPFPYSDNLTTYKNRPAIVVQADGLRSEFPYIIIAQITSQMKRLGRPYRVGIRLSDPQYKVTGLLTDSVIMADLLATLDTKFVITKLGNMPNMNLVDAALKKAMAL